MAEVLTATPGGEIPVGWFRRRKQHDRSEESDLTAQHEAADARLRSAQARRDAEQRKLQEETRSLVQPMRRERQANHFAQLASEAFRRAN